MNTAMDGGESLSAGSHVLIVDDADDTREMYAEFLNKVVGCRVSQLSNGTEVIATVTRDRPDVVVLDLVLPRIDGFDLCRQLRQTPGVEKTPIVVVTALQPLNPAQRSRLDVGHPDALLVKPCPPDKLLAELRVVVARSRQLRAAAGVARGRAIQLREKSENLMRGLEQQRHVPDKPE